MKKLYILQLLLFAVITINAQRIMKVEKYDGTIVEYLTSDVKRVFFESQSEPEIRPVPIPDVVDLGLSVKWASFNIGATKPEEAGGYFAWGETEEKDIYNVSTYLYKDKYLGKCICGSPYDVATVKLGSSWRLPTAQEIYEFRTMCQQEWISVNGISGYKIIGPNGNSIFLPAAGIFLDAGVKYYNEDGRYMTGNMYDTKESYHFSIDYSKLGIGSSSHGKGYTVRAVYDDSNASVNISVTTGSANVSADCNARLSATVTGVSLGVSVGFIMGRNANVSLENGEVQYMRSNDTFEATYYSLPFSTTYYYRAFAYVNGNYIYGDVKSFTTPSKTNAVAEPIDLGLSVKWASFNLGASKPEEYGSYLSWSEANSPSAEIRAAWGTSWRLPTLQEVEELANKCNKSWETVNGIKGLRFTASNGNSVFFPAGGEGEDHRYIEEDGNYWTSTSANNSQMETMYFNMTERLIKYEHLMSYYLINVRYVYDNGQDDDEQGGTPHEEETSLCPDANHPHTIDLGLPSGTQWSCCNVGASKPEDYGDYYAWGETQTKNVYNWSTYIHCDGSSSTCHDIGTDIAGTDYDVAYVKWGGSWKMPTSDQMKELWDNCTHEWTTINGYNGYKFNSPNGNSIFLPAAGNRSGSALYYAGSYGHYWSSTLNESRPSDAYYLDFDSGNAKWYYGGRLPGLSVRPVR